MSKAFWGFPLSNSVRIGEPVSTALSAGKYFNVSGKLQHTLVALGIASLLAKPGVISDSCIIAGTLQYFAARITGTETNPPLENTTSGLSFFRQRID